MPRKVFDSLNEWKRKRRVKEWTRVRDFEQEVRAPDKPPLTMILRDVELETWLAVSIPVHAVESDWKPEIAPSGPDAMARCQVVALNEEEAECMVILDGLELPRVSFPAWVIRQKGLAVGGRFIWIMRDGSRVRPSDIDPEIPQTDKLTSGEQAELDRLYEEFQRRRAADGGDWPEHTGSGR